MIKTELLASLKVLAKELNNHQINWSLGASLMLYLRGIKSNVDDIDIIVDEKDTELLFNVLQNYQYVYMESSPKYQTKHFYSLEINGIDVDIMIAFKVKTKERLYIYPFHVDQYVLIDRVRIPLASISEWFKAYQAMERQPKIDLITSYLDSKITTERLLIEPLDYKDRDDLFEYLKKDEVHLYENSTAYTIEKLEDSMSWLVSSNHFYSVKKKDTKKHIGHIYFSLSSPPHFKEYMVGYIFNPTHQNKGYCTEAVTAIIDNGFKNKDIHRVKAMCNPDNIASWKVMEKVGLIREGRLRNRVHFKNDREGNPIWWDEFVYGIVKEDWFNK